MEAFTHDYIMINYPYYAISPQGYMLYWNTTYTENNGYIIHNVNLKAYYRTAQSYNNYCSYGMSINKGINFYVRNTSHADDWLRIKESSSNSYNYFSGDIRNSIDRNNYSIMLKAQETGYCVELTNASLIINCTKIGSINIKTDVVYLSIPTQSSSSLNFVSTCREDYCGKITYEITSANGKIRPTGYYVSQKYLGTGTGETNSEEFNMEITAVEPGDDIIYVSAKGFYGGQNLGILGEAEIPVFVSSGAMSTESPGKLIIESIDCPNPTAPLYRGEEFDVGATVKCIEGNCGDVTGTISTLLDISGSRNMNYIIDKDQSRFFSWLVSSRNAVIGDDASINMDFGAKGINSVQKTCTITFMPEELPTTTILNINIDHPKIPTSIKVNEQFELYGRIECAGDCTGPIKYYALYKNSTSNFMEIGSDTQIYFADGIQTNPHDYGPATKWNLKSRDSGAYDIAIKVTRDESVLAMQNTGQIEFYGDGDGLSSDEISLDIISPTIQNTFKRGDEFDIRIRAHRNESHCTDCLIKISSSLMEKDILLEYSNGFYIGKGRISDIAEGLGNMQATVNGVLRGERELLVEPSIQITGSADKQIYSTFDEIKIMGVTAKKAYVSAELLCGDMYKKKSASFQADGLGAYSIDNIVISRAVPAGSCQIEVSAVDLSNNHGKMALDVIIRPSNMNNYNLDILSPSVFEGKITKGIKVPIIVRLTQNNIDAKNMEVICTDANGDYTIQLDQEIDDNEKVFYKKDYAIPLKHNKTEWVLSCIGEKDNEYGTNSLIIPLEKTGLILKVLEPSPYEQMQPGQIVKIKVRAEYSNGVPANEALIKMKINGGEDIFFERGPEPGTYVGTFDTGEKEILSFVFSSIDDDGISGSPESLLLTVKKPDIGDYIFYIIGAVVIIVVLFSAIVVYARKGKTTYITKTEKIDMEEIEKKVEQKHITDRRFLIKEKLRDMQLEYENIENDIDMLHSEYFRREIDEETFVKLLQERKERKENISSTIGGLAKELSEIEANGKSSRKQKQGENVNYGENEGTS